MEQQKLVDFLNEYLPWVDYNTPTMINRGGCAFFAHALASSLDAMGAKYQIYAMFLQSDWDTETELEALKQIVAGTKKVDSETMETHVMIKIEGLYFDSEGGDDADNTGKVGKVEGEQDSITNKLPITMEILKQQIELGDWNDKFDRSLLPEIKKKLSEIPKLIQTWKKGDYPKVDIEKKELNDYTKKHLMLFWL